jgi:DNA repair protein RadC
MRDFNPKEYRVMTLRDCPVPSDMLVCETPQQAVDYWRLHIETHPYFNPECECFAVLLLNTRKRVKGHQLVTHGTMDTLLVHPREVFRTAIITSASCIVLMHNHPSGVIPHPVLCRMTSDLP